jgi:signal transduction histidine kinase
LLIKIFLTLSLFLTSFASFGNDVLPRFTSFEVFTDESGQSEFSAVLEQKEWQTVSGDIFTGGYSHAVHWLKLSFQAPEHESLLLTVIMTMLDDVRLYAPQELIDTNARVAPKPAEFSTWQVWQQGDLFAFDQREKDWRGFSFALKVQDQKTHTVYLRVKSISTHLIYPQLWRLQEFIDYQKNEMLLLGFMSGLMLVLLVIAIGFYVVTKKTLQKYYLALLILTICYLFSVNGFTSQWLLKDYPIIASNLVGVIVGLLQIPAFGFHREFLFGKMRHLLVYRVQSVIMSFGWITAIFAAFGKYDVVAECFNSSIFLSLFVVFFIVVYMRFKNKLSNGVCVIYLILLPANLITLLGLLGVNTATSWLSIYGTQIGSLINLAILICITLFYTYKTLSNNQLVISQAQLDSKAAQSQRYWMAMLTHEIKTPLSVINASCQSMELLTQEPALKMRLSKIKRNITRIDDLVKHFLGNDEVPARLQHLHKNKVDLSKWLNTQLTLFDEAAQKRWRVDVEEKLTVFADADLLAIALNNLLTNSLKYSRANTLIEITVQTHLHQTKNGVLFSVKDYGVAITDEKRVNLFTRFQLNEYVGNGVGLWACQEIARAHGGEVWLDDKRNDGNTFTIWLPMKNEGFNV